MRIDMSAGGKVGIGTTSPNTELNVKGTNASAGDIYTAVGAGNVPSITIENDNTTNNNNAALFFRDDTDMRASIGARFVSHTGGDQKTQLRFAVCGSGATREKVVITEDGHMGVGTMTPSFPIHSSKAGTSYVMSETTASSASAGFRLKGDADADFTLFTTQSTNQFAIYDNRASLERFQIESDGTIKIDGDNITVINGSPTPLTIADDASYAISTSGTGTAGSCFLSVYEGASGNPALYHVGFGTCAILNGASTYAAADTDGKFCVIVDGHNITFKNRIGASKNFNISVFGAGNTNFNS